MEIDIPKNILEQTKNLYDKAYKSRSFMIKKSEALPELVVDGFDTEQIWQQIELENKEVLSEINLDNLNKVLTIKKFEFPVKLSDNEDEQSEISQNQSEDDDEIVENLKNEEEYSDDEMNDDDSELKSDKRKAKQTFDKSKKKRKTEVDDKFFSLHDMDEYVSKEEKKEMKGKPKNDSDEDDESLNEEIDLFNNLSEEDEDDQGETVMYKDFFDDPEQDDNENHDNVKEDDDVDDDDESESEFHHDKSDNESDEPCLKKKVAFNLLEDDSNELLDSQKESKNNTNKSSFEARQDRLKKDIERWEQEAVSEKPWQLKGEATAHTRPKNSLLEEYIEFDSALRPAPIMTEKVTIKLEDVIRQRIKDNAWDDVEKKFKPVETPSEYKKKLVMNQEKSKESLAQIYEKEYLQQKKSLITGDQNTEEKEIPPEHIEIKQRINLLFSKLDALSNFHYTPKPAKPEIKIISNELATNMEEVGPLVISEATTLAPEEILGKPKGDLLGKSERNKTDKKRERRKKKVKQHHRALYQNKKEKEQSDEPNLSKRFKKTKAPKITGRNVVYL